MTRSPEPGRRLLYGRRVGKSLSPRKERLLAELLPRLAVPLTDTAPDRLERLFGGRAAAHVLEIGFGGGEHLAHEAARAPRTGFIGAEPFVNGLVKMLDRVAAAGLTNVRLHHGDGREVIAWLPDACLDRADLLYPDPWPKARHRKRRFVGADTLDALARVLRPGGLFRFASDIDDYVAWTLARVLAHPAFEWLAERADDWRRPWPGWPGTRYEDKALREGRRPVYLTFRRR